LVIAGEWRNPLFFIILHLYIWPKNKLKVIIK
jgi:hypothetical protein